MTEPVFPPLLSGIATVDDPLQVAVQMAQTGCDGGTVVYNLGGPDLRAAIVFAPEVPLTQAMAMLPTCGIGFHNALGAVAPPEVGVHLDWDGGIRLNGALAGRLEARAATADPQAVPDWLIIGLTLRVVAETDDPGQTPDRTTLYGEGCAEVAPVDLLEGWARHTLVWLHRWTQDGNQPLHAELAGLMQGLGTGDFIGLDADFGQLLRQGDKTVLRPLTALLAPATPPR